MIEKPMNLRKLLERTKNRRAALHSSKARKRAIKAGYAYQPRHGTAAKVKDRAKPKAFVGVDGEGGGVNKRGQQYYRLLRAGNHVLFNDNRPLTTVECLDFIVKLPPRKIYVGFAFGYDATMILRDLPEAYVGKLFSQRTKFSSYTYWRNYAIDYLPGHYLRVARLDPATNRLVTGTARTIFETYGFFQSSFVQALEHWDIGSKAERDAMARTKDDRSSFSEMTPKLIEYNRQETEWLARMMETFRERCHAAGLRPRTWNGAGKLAAALLRQHDVIKADRVQALLPAEVFQAAQYAYYGGRAELAWHGVLPECWAYDLRSAYPAAMLEVPCLEHGSWETVDAAGLTECTQSEDSLFLTEVEYRHKRGTVWCGLPHRDTTGGLRFLRWGKGVYWSHEIRAAQRLGTEIRWRKGWLYHKNCECRPLAFVADIYRQRQALDRLERGRGTPLKLALNALYGKFAQRLGLAPWQNHLWAGFITATTRARLLDAMAAAGDPSEIIMVATDAVFSRVRLDLDLGSELGQWEEREDGPSFFAKPGIYWQLKGDRLKSRGIDHKAVRSNKETIEAAWHRWSERVRLPAYWARGAPFTAPFPYPVMTIHVGGFLGLRLAVALGRLDQAGSWKVGAAGARKFGFSWGTKRRDFICLRATESAAGLALLTLPYDGTGGRSTHWEPLPDTLLAREADLRRWWADGQPDGADQDDLLEDEA